MARRHSLGLFKMCLRNNFEDFSPCGNPKTELSATCEYCFYVQSSVTCTLPNLRHCIQKIFPKRNYVVFRRLIYCGYLETEQKKQQVNMYSQPWNIAHGPICITTFGRSSSNSSIKKLCYCAQRQTCTQARTKTHTKDMT